MLQPSTEMVYLLVYVCVRVLLPHRKGNAVYASHMYLTYLEWVMYLKWNSSHLPVVYLSNKMPETVQIVLTASRQCT